MNITADHKNTKNPDYWNDLIGGTTSQYKEAVMAELISRHLKRQVDCIADIGCGTCETILKYGKLLKAKKLICTDYDAKIIEAMKLKHQDKPIEWRTADLFELKSFNEQLDLVFFMDMLHEIYSFYGRPQKDLKFPVDHQAGQEFVKQAVKNIAQFVTPGGGIVITDNVLCEENVSVRVHLQRAEVIEAVRYFFENYSTKSMPHQLSKTGELTINSRDFCILLTQYNKIKRQDWKRWSTERYEIHQYMTLSEYTQMFRDLDFQVHAVIGTPQETRDEWEEDFKVSSGLSQIPEKRITLLAVKT